MSDFVYYSVYRNPVNKHLSALYVTNNIRVDLDVDKNWIKSTNTSVSRESPSRMYTYIESAYWKQLCIRGSIIRVLVRAASIEMHDLRGDPVTQMSAGRRVNFLKTARRTLRTKSRILGLDLQCRVARQFADSRQNCASRPPRYYHFPPKRCASFLVAVDTGSRDTVAATQIAGIRCISAGVRSI